MWFVILMSGNQSFLCLFVVGSYKSYPDPNVTHCPYSSRGSGRLIISDNLSDKAALSCLDLAWVPRTKFFVSRDYTLLFLKLREDYSPALRSQGRILTNSV